MNIIPRKEEWLPVASLLESDAYDTAEALAKAIVRECYIRLLERDFWLTVVDLDGTTIAYGLYPSQIAAEKAEPGIGWRRLIVPVSSAVAHANRMELLMQPPSVKEKPVKVGRR